MSDSTALHATPEAPYHCCARRRLFGPLLLIGLGVVFLLQRFHLLGAGHLIVPVIFVVMGLAILAEPRSRQHMVWGLVWLGAGTLMALSSLGHWNYDVTRLWPLLLIAAGVSMLAQGPWRRGL